MNILIRCDSSIIIGSGHIIRCLAFALALKEQGHRVEFACILLTGNLIPLIENYGFKVIQIPANTTETLQIPLTNIKYDAVVIDHYGIDYRQEMLFRSIAKKVVVIDDFGERKHDADLIVDPSISSNTKSRKNINADLPIVSGSNWVLLRPEFEEIHPLVSKRTQFKNILVFFGGTDPSDQMIEYLELISKPNLELNEWFKEQKIHFHLLVSDQHPRIEYFKKQILPPNISIHRSPSSIANLMNRMDFYLGSSGTITWERMCMGLTGIVISIIDNQEDIAQTLYDLDLHYYAGSVKEIKAKHSLKLLKKALTQDSDWSERSDKCLKLIDGKGAKRLVQELEKLLTNSPSSPATINR